MSCLHVFKYRCTDKCFNITLSEDKLWKIFLFLRRIMEMSWTSFVLYMLPSCVCTKLSPFALCSYPYEMEKQKILHFTYIYFVWHVWHLCPYIQWLKIHLTNTKAPYRFSSAAWNIQHWQIQKITCIQNIRCYGLQYSEIPVNTVQLYGSWCKIQSRCFQK